MNDPDIEKLIDKLKNDGWQARRNAALALEKIGAPAVPALIVALKDKNERVRIDAALTLGNIGDISALPALIEQLEDLRYSIRRSVTTALLKMGDIARLQRKVLTFRELSIQKQAELLEALRRAPYQSFEVILIHNHADIRTFCRNVLKEKDTELHAAAQQVLDWLNGDRHLLRPSQMEDPTEARELLRASAGASPETNPETLLRAADLPENVSEPRLTILQRLFGNAKR